MRVTYLVMLVLLSLGIGSTSVQASDWEAVFAEWSADHPDLAKQWEKAKKDAEKSEKNIKKIADKEFQNSFDAVFGKDKYKPSDALEVIKVVEALSAGDLEFAGKASTGLLIAKYVPVLGQYITVAKAVVSAIKEAEQVWIKGLYQTKAYTNFTELLYAEPTGENAYIPSYMITYLRKNEQLGAEITKIYQDMRDREDRMFKKWLYDEKSVTQMMLAPWASRWISARGKVPTEREMFNYFLYHTVKNAKAKYMERFVDEYMRPLVRHQAYLKKQQFLQAMTVALASIAAQANAEDNSAQCEAWGKSYNDHKALRDAQKVKMQTFFDSVEVAYKKVWWRYNDAYNIEAAKRRQPIEEEGALLDEERLEVERLQDQADENASTLRSIASRVSSMKGSLPSSDDPDARNAAISSINSEISNYNDVRSSQYMPAKSAADDATDAFNRKLDAYKIKRDAFFEQPVERKTQTLNNSFDRIRETMKQFKSRNLQCKVFSRYAVEDNLQGLIGMSPEPGIALCKVAEMHQEKMKAILADYDENCR